MENDPANAKRLEDILIKRMEFTYPKPEAAAPSDGRTDATKRARRDQIWQPQDT